MSDETPTAAAPKPKSKLVVFIALALLSAGGAAGATWFFTRHQGAEVAQAHAVEKKPIKKPVFMTLDPFTVNLQDARGERFAQIGVTLQLYDVTAENDMKDRLPAVRNEILLLIASKRIDELLTDEGKRALAQQIRTRAGLAMSLATGEAAPPPPTAHAAPAGAGTAVAANAVENPVQDVLFSQFLVQ